MDFGLIDKIFKKYVDAFDWNDENIRLKYFHTLEVASISYRIASDLGLSEEDRELALLIGYLHDIGRFEQITRVKTFKDKVLDHADNGVRLLFDEGVLRKFVRTSKYDEIIKKAVRNHNKYEILDEVTERERLFANIIRDSDKIDILRVRREYYQDKIILPPSSAVLECIDKEKPVQIKDIKNKSDSILCVLAFIFDFNYDVSLNVLKEKGYYEQLIDSIEVSQDNKEVFDGVKQKVLKKLYSRKEDSIC